MRINPLAIIPLALAMLALVISAFTVGWSPSLMAITIGLAVATALVAIATLFQYTRSSAEAKQVPVENFSLWADVGEPAAELRRMGYENVQAAVRIAAADLGSLAANAELLSARIAMLLGKEGFAELSSSGVHREVEKIARGVNLVVEKLRSGNGLSPEIVAPLEEHASSADRVANKLFEFEKGKSEVVRIYVDPLRRASEKLSRDLRVAFGNINSFISGKPPQ
ncbi:MAG: hypothetical protein QW567_03820 [Candidatus Hadarchaeales archaeon]